MVVEVYILDPFGPWANLVRKFSFFKRSTYVFPEFHKYWLNEIFFIRV